MKAVSDQSAQKWGLSSQPQALI